MIGSKNSQHQYLRAIASESSTDRSESGNRNKTECQQRQQQQRQSYRQLEVQSIGKTEKNSLVYQFFMQ